MHRARFWGRNITKVTQVKSDKLDNGEVLSSCASCSSSHHITSVLSPSTTIDAFLSSSNRHSFLCLELLASMMQDSSSKDALELEVTQQQQQQQHDSLLCLTLENSPIAHNTCFDALAPAYTTSITPNLRATLYKEWNQAWSSIAKNEEDDNNNVQNKATTDKWFDRLYLQHNETGRYYHTVVHLHELLSYLKILEEYGVVEVPVRVQQRQQQQCCCVLRLAIFFHDAVYDAKSSTNEIDSANLFQECCRELRQQQEKQQPEEKQLQQEASRKWSCIISPEMEQQVVTFILATQRHEIILLPLDDDNGKADDNSNSNSNYLFLQKLFLDLDMSVLAKHAHAYRAYAACIRQEYSFVPPNVYCEKRAAILTAFLGSTTTTAKCDKHLYWTPILQTAWETRARNNLKAEIISLEKGILS
jgi:predicted metal-dependent HD superfamily phosphohydrolase